MQPLADVRVIASEQFGAGPWGTLQLADLGAEVIKIEDPSSGGDVSRYVPPFQDGEAYRAPPNEPTRRRAGDRPADRKQDRGHGCKVSRMASSGAGRPVHASNDRAPCARSTAQPSAVRRPTDRALRTNGVPPVT